MTLVVIAGPTGSGKSELAVRLARALGGEIVNYDSMQIYRGFDIGTAKPSVADRASVPHHLFDMIEGDQEFNAADFGRVARRTCAEIQARGRIPILAGGTFFYLRALLSGLPEMPGRDENLRKRLRTIAGKGRGPMWLHRLLSRVDPPTAARIPPADRHRVERALEVWLLTKKPISSWERPRSDSVPLLPATRIALQVDRAQLIRRLDERVETMYRAGLIDEAAGLLRRFPPTARPFGAIGYREAAAVVNGSMDAAAAEAETKRRTRAYAKRQTTWLRSERNMQWIDASDRENTYAAAVRLLREVGR